VYPKSYGNNQESQYTGKDTVGNVYFRGYPVIPSGWIRVRVEPSDAAVLINGHFVSVDASSGVSLRTGYQVGIHTVQVHRQGLTSYEGEVEVRPGNEIYLDIKLTK
jgi:hypothetical protein